MTLFDTSIESVGCSVDDLKNLHYFDTTHVVTSLSAPSTSATTDQIVTQFTDFIDDECTRLAGFGFSAYCALGIAGTPPKRVHGELWPRFEELAASSNVVAIGLIGVDTDFDRDWSFFEQQGNIAQSLSKPMIISSPRKMPATRTYAMMSRLESRASSAMFRVATETVLEPLLTEGFQVSLLVQNGAFLPEDVLRVLEKFPQHQSQLSLSSGLCGESGDVLALPKTALALQEGGAGHETLEQISFRNALEFFKIVEA